MLFTSLDCVVLGKTAPEVLSAAQGRRHRVQFFPIRTSRLANNIYLSEIIHRLSVFPTYESKITFQILICLCWSHSFAPIHQNLKFRTWVQVITVLKMWDISLHSRSLYSIRRRVLTFQCELPLGERFIHENLSFRRFWSQFSKVHHQKRPILNFVREKSDEKC